MSTHDILPLVDDWTVEGASTGVLPASVPGTVAGALRDAGASELIDRLDLDATDWTFATRFAAAQVEDDEEVVLCCNGIASVAEIELNGHVLEESRSMFIGHELDVSTHLLPENELVIRCRALGPLLAERRRPRARWRTRLVSNGNVRFFRTMLLGRMPGVAPAPAAVGPWRPVVLERRRGLAVDALKVRSRLDGTVGVVTVQARLRSLIAGYRPSVEITVTGPAGEARESLRLDETGVGVVELRIADVARWWPHTHGEPALYDVHLLADDFVIDAGAIGFRQVETPAEIEQDGLDLQINGERMFVRGAVWTPADPVNLAASPEQIRATVLRARDAGLNMLRVPGTAAYEGEEFFEACDELGVLVWHDFMFANLDYPVADDGFRTLVEREAREFLGRSGQHASLVVLCGNSEVEQQVAMLGLDPALGRGELFDTILPSLVRDADIDAAYVPSAPCGGALPFHTNSGIANYFGVGAYLRPLSDARLAQVRFAAECLAFANVPDEDVVGTTAVNDPEWKRGVPRDAGAAWDFDDVRDHYLGELFDVNPARLRATDPERYLEWSRAVTGEVMAETFGEWRRACSPTSGALVLWLRDLRPGAGWGILDHRGEPKVVWHHLRRALAPVAVWLTDEGLGGVDAHVANDRPELLDAQLRVSLYRNLGDLTAETTAPVRLAANTTGRWNLEELLGRFLDVSYAYRFGRPGHDVVVATLERPERALLSQSFTFPAGRPTRTESREYLGVEATARMQPSGVVELVLAAQKLVYGLRIHAQGFHPSDNAFSLEPQRRRHVFLTPAVDGAPLTDGYLTALNLDGIVSITSEPDA